jgi:DNA-binding TFAR19-related protein (PDSD5 family)
MLRRVALVKPDVSEELRASIISVTRISDIISVLEEEEWAQKYQK